MVVNFFEEKSAPPDKILATPMTSNLYLSVSATNQLSHVAVRRIVEELSP